MSVPTNAPSTKPSFDLAYSLDEYVDSPHRDNTYLIRRVEQVMLSEGAAGHWLVPRRGGPTVRWSENGSRRRGRRAARAGETAATVQNQGAGRENDGGPSWIRTTDLALIRGAL